MQRFTVKLWLYPISALVGLYSLVRNYFYDKRIIRSVSFDVPVISIGNLCMGGTGKTPMTEYLLTLLREHYRIATLSRGYRRKSSGFRVVGSAVQTDLVGDEPQQIKLKFPETVVTVCEDRLVAIPRIMQEFPSTNVILMDDAFQHRSVQPGLSVLLTDYNRLFTRDELFPVGLLRESRKGYHRADVIVVTKCPPDISADERQAIRAEIAPYPYQHLYFACQRYGRLFSLLNPAAIFSVPQSLNVLLVTGIADATSLQRHLKTQFHQVFERTFSDHHWFDAYDLDLIRDTLSNIPEPRVIVSTEKDATRLLLHRAWFVKNGLDVLVQPVFMQFLNEDGPQFDADVFHFMGVKSAESFHGQAQTD